MTSREEMESKLKFLGFLILLNNLKPESQPTIEILKNANIKCVMATGDSPLTAISVGKSCSLINDEVPVFLGDFISLDGINKIVWTNVD